MRSGKAALCIGIRARWPKRCWLGGESLDAALVKAEAEDVILSAGARIGEEIAKAPKAKGGGQRGKNGFTAQGKSIGRTDWPHGCDVVRHAATSARKVERSSGDISFHARRAIVSGGVGLMKPAAMPAARAERNSPRASASAISRWSRLRRRTSLGGVAAESVKVAIGHF